MIQVEVTDLRIRDLDRVNSDNSVIFPPFKLDSTIGQKNKQISGENKCVVDGSQLGEIS